MATRSVARKLFEETADALDNGVGEEYLTEELGRTIVHYTPHQLAKTVVALILEGASLVRQLEEQDGSI